jgi:hypothetical protein
MPIRKVRGGYRWGRHGKVYPTRSGALRQARAAYANGYSGDSRRRSSMAKKHHGRKHRLPPRRKDGRFRKRR